MLGENQGSESQRMNAVDEEDLRREVSSLKNELRAYKEWIGKMTDVCAAAAQGDLEKRLLGCTDESDASKLGLSINRMLDVTDAFVREAGASLEHASQ